MRERVTRPGSIVSHTSTHLALAPAPMEPPPPVACLAVGLAPRGGQDLARLDAHRYALTFSSDAGRSLTEVVAFLTAPLAPGTALGCHLASPPFEPANWRYCGALTNATPSASFRTSLIFSGRDAQLTTLMLGVEVQPEASLAQRPVERRKDELLEAGRRIGKDLYDYVSSFAERDGAAHVRVPTNVFDKWFARFDERCVRFGMEWLLKADGF